MPPTYHTPYGGAPHDPGSLDQLSEWAEKLKAEVSALNLKSKHKTELETKLETGITDIQKNVDAYRTVVGGHMQGVIAGRRFHDLKEHYRKSLECVVHHLGPAKVEAIRRAIHGEVLEPIGVLIARLGEAEKKLFGVYDPAHPGVSQYEATTMATADAVEIAKQQYNALTYESLLHRNERIGHYIEKATAAQGDTTTGGDASMRLAYAYLWLAKQWIKRVVSWTHLTIDIGDFRFPDPDDYEPWLIRAYLKQIRLQEAADKATEEKVNATNDHASGLKELGDSQNLDTFEENVKKAAEKSCQPHPPHGHGYGHGGAAATV